MIQRIFGARSTKNVREVLQQRFASAQRKRALIASVSILLGKIKTPFNIQKIRNPGNDVAAYVISGVDAREIE
jgi:hypothetical protein